MTELSSASVLEGATEELDALQLLCSALARVFSYPTRPEAAAFSDFDAFRFLQNLQEKAGLIPDVNSSDSLEMLFDACLVVANDDPERRVSTYRQLSTQLFYEPSAPVSLEGRRHIVRDPDEPEFRLGESASVLQTYRLCGLKMRRGVFERPDALPTELDFVAFLIRREMAFGREGNGGDAIIWKRRRTVFVTRHLVPLVLAVVAGLNENTSWAPLLYWASLLQRLTDRLTY